MLERGSSLFAVTTYILEDTLHIITLYTPIADGFVRTMYPKTARLSNNCQVTSRYPTEGPAVPTSSLVT
jgi:hypothetical protein